MEKAEPEPEPENDPKVEWNYSLPFPELLNIIFELYRRRPEASMMQRKITALILNGNQIIRLVGPGPLSSVQNFLNYSLSISNGPSCLSTPS